MLNAVKAAERSLRFHTAKLIVHLLDQSPAYVEPVDREVAGQHAVGKKRLAPNNSRMAGRCWRRFFISVGRAFGDEGIETLAQEAGIGAGAAEHLAPTQPTRQVHIGREIALPS